MLAPNTLEWLSDYALGRRFEEDSGLSYDNRAATREQLNFSVTGLMHELFGAADKEDSRYSSGLGRLLSEFQQGNADFDATDSRLRQQTFSRESDRIHTSTQRSMSGLRGALGASGLGFDSGAAMGIASQVNLGRLGQLTGAKRDVAIDSANRRLTHSNQRFQKMIGIAQFENQSPSLLRADAMRTLADVRSGQLATEEQKNAQKQASKNAFQGALAQGGLGLLGSAF